MSSKCVFVLLAVVVGSLFVCRQASAENQNVTLAWNASPSPNIAGYVVHYGSASGNYAYQLDVGNRTNAAVTGLQPGMTYFFVVTAYNAVRESSEPSNEISYRVPLLALPTITLALSQTQYLAPASINFGARVTANGHAITKVQYYNGAQFVGESAAGPSYAFVWRNVPAGSYTVFARLLYDSSNALDSLPANLTVSNVQVQWQISTVGNVIVPGTVIYTNGIWRVYTAGTFGSTADNFRFVHQPLSGDGEITARIRALRHRTTVARAGIMMRETLAGNSRYVFLGLRSDGRLRWQSRATTGGTILMSDVGYGMPPNVWVRLVRSGNTIRGYQSTDGITWKSAGATSVVMASNIQFGLAAVSGSTTVTNVASFSNVKLVP